MTAVGFVLAAALGGVLRWAVVRWWACSWQALFAVNVVGSATLGLLVGRDVDDTVLTIVGVGFAGSLTTFSSFVVEVGNSRPRWAIAQIALQLVACLGVATAAMSW